MVKISEGLGPFLDMRQLQASLKSLVAKRDAKAAALSALGGRATELNAELKAARVAYRAETDEALGKLRARRADVAGAGIPGAGLARTPPHDLGRAGGSTMNLITRVGATWLRPTIESAGFAVSIGLQSLLTLPHLPRPPLPPVLPLPVATQRPARSMPARSASAHLR